MIKEIKNIMSYENYEVMRNTVIKMNENIEKFIYEEMLRHEEDYDQESGLRRTAYAPHSSDIQYECIPLTGSKGHKIGLEYVRKKEQLSLAENQKAILYIHGAAFQRRLQDLNLKTAERICNMTGYPVYVPDYRVGMAYHVREMLRDIVDSYRYLVEVCKYKAENITMMADSSGGTSLMGAIQRLEENSLKPPGAIILMSSFTDARLTNQSVKNNWDKDIAFVSNNLFMDSIKVFTREGKRDINRADISTISGDYRCLKDTRVLLQVGRNERLLDDSVQMYHKLKQICSCTLEIYEDMFHNFETYYSMCEMAKVSSDNQVQFIMN